MKLVRNLGKKLNKYGNPESWGVFLCEFDNKIVERRLSNGYRDKSCGCQQYSEEVRQKMSKSGKNKTFTEEHIENLSAAQKIRWEKIPIEKRKKSEEIRQKMRDNHVDVSGENNPMYATHRFGEDNPNWKNGKSFEIYPQEFNKELKNFILERDKHQCQDPNCDGNHKKLHVHHIDYDKKNNNPDNLITLCVSCHSKTNGKNNRQYFTEYYQNIIMGKVMECLL